MAGRPGPAAGGKTEGGPIAAEGGRLPGKCGKRGIICKVRVSPGSSLGEIGTFL